MNAIYITLVKFWILRLCRFLWLKCAKSVHLNCSLFGFEIAIVVVHIMGIFFTKFKQYFENAWSPKTDMANGQTDGHTKTQFIHSFYSATKNQKAYKSRQNTTWRSRNDYVYTVLVYTFILAYTHHTYVYTHVSQTQALRS